MRLNIIKMSIPLNWSIDSMQFQAKVNRVFQNLAKLFLTLFEGEMTRYYPKRPKWCICSGRVEELSQIYGN